MDLEVRKYNFIQELVKVDESLLEKLEMVLKANRKDWFHELPINEREEIETGIKEANNNEFVENDEVMLTFSRWH